MGNIFYVMGKSATGKDTIFKLLLERRKKLKTIVPYTTRPIRAGETDGVEYFFVTEKGLGRLREEGKVIEERTYQTVLGPWSYFTVNDGQFDQEDSDYLMIGTLESYEKMRQYFGKEKLIPVYVEAEDGIRLERAVNREKFQKEPRFAEVCRRYLADEQDFCEENLISCGICTRYKNSDLDACLEDILAMMDSAGKQ